MSGLPSPEQLEQASPDIALEEETEDLKTQEHKQEEAQIGATNQAMSKGKKVQSIQKPRSVKSSSKCSTTVTKASDKKAKAQV